MKTNNNNKKSKEKIERTTGKLSLSVVVHTFNSSTWKTRQEHQRFKVNLGYIVNSRLAWTVQDTV